MGCSSSSPSFDFVLYPEKSTFSFFQKKEINQVNIDLFLLQVREKWVWDNFLEIISLSGFKISNTFKFVDLSELINAQWLEICTKIKDLYSQKAMFIDKVSDILTQRMRENSITVEFKSGNSNLFFRYQAEFSRIEIYKWKNNKWVAREECVFKPQKPNKGRIIFLFEKALF